MAKKSNAAEAGIEQIGQGDTRQAVKSALKNKPRLLPPYNVVLLNDNEHTYEYVIQLLRKLFAYSDEKGYQLARQVDESHRAVVFTAHKELAELKREQIGSFGADPRISSCKGSMSAMIELA
ncbi:MAG TPA: ATP-dependent Clp protease adaptor ClpS [Tepidisphaeraceae bacterium]|jgi:ATP-dependent Clp protease adaptor protein ClpS|nr:ATP-dependent Clp protease adaptor ClpS [Tepidisphaeraceae bacterium]